MKFGLLGTGKWGRHYQRLLPEYGELVVMDKEIDPSVDCVVIATPSLTHFEYIKKALELDKHILVEKPMVLSVKDAEEVKSLIGAKVFMVAHQYCYNDEVLKMKPKDEITLIHSYQGENPWREIAPHLFSVVDILGFKETASLRLVNTKEKIRQWLFDDEPLKEPKTEPLRNEIEHFVHCVKNNKKPKTDIEHALRVIKNIERIERYEAEYPM